MNLLLHRNKHEDDSLVSCHFLFLISLFFSYFSLIFLFLIFPNPLQIAEEEVSNGDMMIQEESFSSPQGF